MWCLATTTVRHFSAGEQGPSTPSDVVRWSVAPNHIDALNCAGDVIEEVNQQAVSQPGEVSKAIEEAATFALSRIE
jgi:hypothetical protein